MIETMRISPRYTTTDWAALRPRLSEPLEEDAWLEACQIATDRVANRFLLPVQILMDHPQSPGHGFGFAMLALDCLLIDTLQAFREGRTSGNEARSTKAFVDFLVECPRFASEFVSKSLAREFVESVRNGLLHDGETRQGWRVRQQSPDGKILAKVNDGWILFRNQFHVALEQEFNDYLDQLRAPEAGELRSRFLLRMDSICGILPERNTVFYFAYGSNMNEEQMNERVPGAARVGIAYLREHRVVFNKRSNDGTGKANIVPDKQAGLGVWGLMFELTKEQLRTLGKHEKGYFQKEVIVTANGEAKQAVTFIAEPSALEQIPPSESYLQRILHGARVLSQEYQDRLRTSAESVSALRHPVL